MIDMQLLNSALMALAILVGAAIALSAAMAVAAIISRRPRRAPGQPPHGGTRRDLPQHPAPDQDDARELVLL
jgi:hypothetical protein